MNVGVLEAGQNQSATRVHGPGAAGTERLDLVIAADGDDAATAGGQRLGARLQRIHGADIAIDDEKIGRRLGHDPAYYTCA